MFFFTRFLQLILTISIIIVAYSGLLLQILSDNTKLTNFLDSSGIYSVTSLIVGDNLQSQVTKEDLPTVFILENVKNIATPALMKQILQPAQIVLIDWIRSEKPIAELKLELDISKLKRDVIEKSPDPNQKLALSAAIPDSINILGEELTGNQRASFLFALKNIYSLVRDSFWLSLIISVVLISLIFIINIRRGSQKITKIAWPIWLSALIILVIGFTSYVINFPSNIGSKDFSALGFYILTQLLKTIFQQGLTLGLILIIVTSLIIITTKIIFHTTDRKLKQKRK